MCERYVIPDQADVEREFTPAHSWWKFTLSFNVACHRYVPVIRLHEGESEGVMMRWGLIPSWAEGDRTRLSAAHARIEQVDSDDGFRSPWLHSQRCIVPLAGFYGWQLTPQKYRQPYFIRLVSRPVFGLAGLWDRSVTQDDDVIESFALITVPANPLVAEIHNTSQYMPAILRREDYATWLAAAPGPARALLRAYPAEEMLVHAVSPRVNSLKHDDAGLIMPAQ